MYIVIITHETNLILFCFVICNFGYILKVDTSNDNGFDETMLETIRKLEENMKNIPEDAPSEEEMAKIWAQMSDQSENGDDIFPPFFLDIMQKLLAKDVLYPPLKDLSTKVCYSLFKNFEPNF